MSPAKGAARVIETPSEIIPMTAHPSEALARAEPAAPLSRWIRSIGVRLAAWANNCSEYCAAAAMYEQLSALSDAELTRRGLSRATLAQDVAGCMRP